MCFLEIARAAAAICDLWPASSFGCYERGSILQGENTDALGKYAMALSYINEDFMIQLQGPHAEKAQSLKTPIHLNMAACQIRLQDWQGVTWNCSQVRDYHVLIGQPAHNTHLSVLDVLPHGLSI